MSVIWRSGRPKIIADSVKTLSPKIVLPIRDHGLPPLLIKSRSRYRHGPEIPFLVGVPRNVPALFLLHPLLGRTDGLLLRMHVTLRGVHITMTGKVGQRPRGHVCGAQRVKQ